MTTSSNRRSAGTASGFTMVELALCIAIVAFAMVAILGVLPLGLNVQRQNREETIVAQEATQWVDLIRHGGVGWDEVTNYVDYIVIERTPVNGEGTTKTYGFRGAFYSRDNAVPTPDVVLTTPSQIVSLLSIPRFEADQGIIYSNRVTAVCRALGGAYNSQVRPDGTASYSPSARLLEDAFRYQIDVELTPASPLPTVDVGPGNAAALANINLGGYLNALRLDTNLVKALRDPVEASSPARDFLAATLYDFRLVFRWPVFKVADQTTVGNGSRAIRTQIFGRPRFIGYDPNNDRSVYWPGTQLRPRRFDDATINRDFTR